MEEGKYEMEEGNHGMEEGKYGVGGGGIWLIFTFDQTEYLTQSGIKSNILSYKLCNF